MAHLIWTESENDIEAERLESELDDLLELERFADETTDETAQTLIARLCRELGLFRDSETAEPGADPAPALGDWAPPERRSSA